MFRKAAIALFLFAATLQVNAVDMENIYINGFFSQGYLKSTDNELYGAQTGEGTWEFNEAAVSIKAILDDNFTAGIQFMSRDFGPISNNDVSIDWAFLDYRVQDSFGIRVGKFKKPEGLYNTIRDADSVRTSILLPSGIYSEQQRDIQIAVQGVGAYGFLDFGDSGSVDYIAYLGNQPVSKDEPIVRNDIMGNFFGIREGGDIEFKYSYGGQIIWNTPIEGLRLGQSFTSALMEIDGANVTYPWFEAEINDAEFEVEHRVVSSFEYQTEKFTFAGEYMKMKVQSPNSPIGGPITSFGFPAGGVFNLEYESYYLQAIVPVTDKIQVGTYYSWYYEKMRGILDKDDPTDKLNDWAISVKYTINEWWLLKAEVHLFDGWLSTSSGHGMGADEKWKLFALKSSVSF